MKKTLRAICMKLFEITMPLFIILGIVIWGMQMIAILAGKGSLLVWSYKSLYPWASTASSICMFAAFIYSYVKDA